MTGHPVRLGADGRLVTVRQLVVPPIYVPIHAGILIATRPDVVVTDVFVTDLRDRVVQKIEDYLNALKGGSEGEGWPFGRDVYASEIYRLLEKVPGVDYVPDVTLGSICPAGAPRCVAGAELWHEQGLYLPVLTVDRMYLLPGVPQLFRSQLEVVLARLERKPVHMRVLYLSAMEPEIAGVLDRIALAAPEVAIGSYPTFDRAADYCTKLTIEHEAREPVEAVLARLEAELPTGCIVRREG
jgi:hypothetical protein